MCSSNDLATGDDFPSAASKPQTGSPSNPPSKLSSNGGRRERKAFHNFWTLVGYQTVLRTGWIFKTESIIVPAFLAAIGGSAFLQGYLPLLNRLGQSVPPMLASAWIARVSRLKFVLAGMTAIMAACFGVLAYLCVFPDVRGHGSFPYVYLALYACFFTATGIMQLAFGTLQGKLVRVTTRGRLMLMSNFVGAATAITLAAVCLPNWLARGLDGFSWIFGCSAVCFALAALGALTLWEPRTRVRRQETASPAATFSASWQVLRGDANFRLLGMVSAMFACSMMLFPHYTALARANLQLGMKDLFYWVVVQNAGTALFSFIVGPMADRAGNRRVIRLVLLLLFLAPVLALVLSNSPDWGPRLFPLVFLLVGLTPVGVRLLGNYTLEVADAADHPRYLATLGLCLAVPIFFSPLLGWIVDVTGYAGPFAAISAIIGLALLLSRGLLEPRDGESSPEAG